MNTEKNKKKWLEMCVTNLKMRGRSFETIDNYCYAIKKFLNYYNEKTNISKFKEEDIIKYFKKEYLSQNKSGSTYNVNLSGIRLLFIVCFNKELNRILLPNFKQRYRYPTIITKEQFLMLFNNEKNLKYKCWLLLSFCSGLRCIDIANLKVEYVDSKNHKLKVFGKGNKDRFTILPDIVIKFLRLYCKEYMITSGYLFKGTGGKDFVHPGTIGNYFTNYIKNFNIKGITEHSLRHSFATYYLMNGGDLLTLKEMLGHKSLASTEIYIHLARDFNNIKGINYAK